MKRRNKTFNLKPEESESPPPKTKRELCMAEYEKAMAEEPGYKFEWRTHADPQASTVVWAGMVWREDEPDPTTIIITAGNHEGPYSEDSRNPWLWFDRGEWLAFVGGAKDGEFDIE